MYLEIVNISELCEDVYIMLSKSLIIGKASQQNFQIKYFLSNCENTQSVPNFRV